MKILFVENRQMTWIWREVAERLEREGHEIHWIVQNKMFMPNIGIRHFISGSGEYRGPFGVTPIDVEPSVRTLSVERKVRYYKARRSNFAHFQGVIRTILENELPDIIFGEPTQFHELMAIDEARRLGIPFLFPTQTRYPKNRIQFFQYDTLASFGGSGAKLLDETIHGIHSAIVERRMLPGYMSRAPVSALRLFARHFGNKARILASWVFTDRVITPSPIAKLRRNAAARKALARWQGFALTSLPASLADTPWALYAMQMQPESSIDVWGYPWNDQNRIIREAADALGQAGAKLVIKLNPSVKYELDMNLCDLVEAHPHIVPLSLACPMAEVFIHADAVLSVVGTVLIEAIMSGKPVGVLGGHEYTKLPGVTQLSAPSEIASLIQTAAKGCARTATQAEAVYLLKDWITESYDAVLYDPLNQPELATPENLDKIAVSFLDILSKLEQIPRFEPGLRTFSPSLGALEEKLVNTQG